MRKSLFTWLRKLVLLGIASTSLTTINKIYAHDLPIFDSLTPLNCFGVGSCGFPTDEDHKRFTLRPESANQADLTGEVDFQTEWSFADCFGESSSLPVGEATWPNMSSAHSAPVHQLGEGEDFSSGQLADWEQQPYSLGSSLSHPSSSLSLIQAIGIQVPKFDLETTLKLFPKAMLDLYQSPPSHSDLSDGIWDEMQTYQSPRRLVDDYLSDESFVRDWRTSQSYRGLNRLDYVQNQSDSASLTADISGPIRSDARPWIAAAVEALDYLQCGISQELYDLMLTAHFSRQAGGLLAKLQGEASSALNRQVRDFSIWAAAQTPVKQPSMGQPDNLFGQPAFVIFNVGGKEFLLPAKQARHWNCVPMKSKTAGLTADRPSASDFASAQSLLVRELAFSVSDRLELAASQLQRVAGLLRSVADVESQLANRSESEEIR